MKDGNSSPVMGTEIFKSEEAMRLCAEQLNNQIAEIEKRNLNDKIAEIEEEKKAIELGNAILEDTLNNLKIENYDLLKELRKHRVNANEICPVTVSLVEGEDSEDLKNDDSIEANQRSNYEHWESGLPIFHIQDEHGIDHFVKSLTEYTGEIKTIRKYSPIKRSAVEEILMRSKSILEQAYSGNVIDIESRLEGNDHSQKCFLNDDITRYNDTLEIVLKELNFLRDEINLQRDFVMEFIDL